MRIVNQLKMCVHNNWYLLIDKKGNNKFDAKYRIKKQKLGTESRYIH